MSIPGALKFIAAVREDPVLSQQIRDLGAQVSLEALATLGGRGGFDFTADELRSAYKLDWTMRWAHYFGGPASDAERD